MDYNTYLDADIETWPWRLPDFSNLEEEIHFYQKKVKAYEYDENRGKAVLRLQLLLGTAQSAAGELTLAEEMLSDVRSRIVEAWG